MFILVVLGLAATSFALPALELPILPETLFITHSNLDANIPNTELPFLNTIEQPIDIVEPQSNMDERKEEERRLFEEEKRIIEEEKRMIDEKRTIEEEANKIIEDEKRIIEEEEKRIIEEEEKRLIEEEKRMMEEKEERKIVLPALPSPPELPSLDDSIFTTFLKAEKLEESQDVTKDSKPYIFMWKLPRIIFPGRTIIDNIYGPHITLGV